MGTESRKWRKIKYTEKKYTVYYYLDYNYNLHII